MKYCTKCGGEISNHASICEHCGYPVEKTAPVTQTEAQNAAPTASEVSKSSAKAYAVSETKNQSNAQPNNKNSKSKKKTIITIVIAVILIAAVIVAVIFGYRAYINNKKAEVINDFVATVGTDDILLVDSNGVTDEETGYTYYTVFDLSINSSDDVTLSSFSTCYQDSEPLYSEFSEGGDTENLILACDNKYNVEICNPNYEDETFEITTDDNGKILSLKDSESQYMNLRKMILRQIWSSTKNTKIVTATLIISPKAF